MDSEISVVPFRELDETEDGSDEDADGRGEQDPEKRAPVVDDEIPAPESEVGLAERRNHAGVGGATVYSEAEDDQSDGEEDERGELDRETGDTDLRASDGSVQFSLSLERANRYTLDPSLDMDSEPADERPPPAA